MATSGRHMARFSARNCAIGPVRTVPIHPSSQIKTGAQRVERSAEPLAKLLLRPRDEPTGDGALGRPLDLPPS